MMQRVLGGGGMVTVLDWREQAEDGIFGRFLHRMKRRSIQMREEASPAGMYRLLTAYGASPDWDKVALRAGRGARAVVLPRALTLPEHCAVSRFVPEALACAVLKNTAVSVIRACHIPLYRKAVTLVDPEARYTNFVRELLCHCITVKVVTKAGDCYEAVSEEMMEELGAGIVYADSPGLCEGSILVICPRPEDASALCTRAPVLTAGEPLRLPGCRLVGAPELKLPPEWAGCIPRGIAALDFLGAFYADGRWPKGAEQAANSMRCGSRSLRISDIVGYLEQKHPFED